MNEHTLEHLHRKFCNSCNKSLIRIANNWYELHMDKKCNTAKADTVKNECDHAHSNIKNLESTFVVVPSSDDEDDSYMDGRDSGLQIVDERSAYVEVQIHDEPQTELQLQYDLQGNVACKVKKVKNDRKSRMIPSKCENCDQIFSCRSNMRRHQKTAHSNKLKINFEKKRFACAECPASYVLEGALRTHMKKHTQSYIESRKCNMCGRIMCTKQSLKKHKLICQPGRQFPCSYCDKIFTSNSQVRQHIITQHNDRPYMCSRCNESFCTEHYLHVHQRTHQTNNQTQRICTIDNCNRRFVKLLDLKRHQFTFHVIQNKGVPCSICSEVYPDKATLNNHMKNHSMNNNNNNLKYEKIKKKSNNIQKGNCSINKNPNLGKKIK